MKVTWVTEAAAETEDAKISDWTSRRQL